MKFSKFNTMNRFMQSGTTLGILGSGQIGKMLSMVAKRLGFAVCIYDHVSGGPAYSCADKYYISSFDDRIMLKEFLSAVDFITIEFENIPSTVLEFLESHSVPVFPSSSILKICQNRILEKNFLRTIA